MTILEPVGAGTVTGWCDQDRHTECSGEIRTGTGWNWWCTCRCHPEPTPRLPEHQPALDFWRSARGAR